MPQQGESSVEEPAGLLQSHHHVESSSVVGQLQFVNFCSLHHHEGLFDARERSAFFPGHKAGTSDTYYTESLLGRQRRRVPELAASLRTSPGLLLVKSV